MSKKKRTGRNCVCLMTQKAFILLPRSMPAIVVIIQHCSKNIR